MASLVTFGCCLAIFAVSMYFLREWSQGPMCESPARIDGKTVIITGGNNGVGKETVRDLVSRGGKVIVACRNMKKCQAAVNEIQESEKVDTSKVYPLKLDLASLKSVREFVAEFKAKESRLDILINNAGVMATPHQKTEDGFELQIGTNHFGHFLLTHLLLDMIKKSAPSRIVNLSSSAHYMGNIDLDDINFENRTYWAWQAYMDSKLANVLFTKQLAKKLKGTGVTTYVVHPGAIRTGLQDGTVMGVFFDIAYYASYPLWKDIPHGAATTICCAVDENLANESGKYYSNVAEKEPNSLAKDEDLAQRLWDKSLAAVGLKTEDRGTQTE